MGCAKRYISEDLVSSSAVAELVIWSERINKAPDSPVRPREHEVEAVVQ